MSAPRASLAEPRPDCNEPDAPPDPLDRLPAVLEGGAAALFRDAELLQALARLAEDDPAEFACRRDQLARGSIRLRDLDAALAPRREALRRDRPPQHGAAGYRVSRGRIVRDTLTKDGPIEVALCNFAAKIVEEVTLDEGAERSIRLVVEGTLEDGTPLPRAEVAADKFGWMRWPVEAWGARAMVLAGASTADHCRAALQLLSGDVPRRLVYGHTGWREVGGQWLYLHAGGAIGPAGAACGVEVQLPEALAGYVLPAPPEGAELAAAVRSSLGLLGVAPDRVTVPLLGAVYRAVLGPADSSPHLSGPTGAGKTELVACVQQHHGAGLDARHLPGNWGSTGNSLEALAFYAKDELLAVDDFAPGGGTADVQRMHRDADRVLHAAGNRAGRMRLRPDATMRPARPPRGTILSTGEEVPRGQSLRARLFVLELERGEMDWTRLTACQRDAAEGLYAGALAGFVRHLATRYAVVRDGLRAETAAIRGRVRTKGLHARTPGIVADLAAGWQHWLDHAAAVGAIDAGEREALYRRVWAALLAAAVGQAEHVEAADPAALYLRLLGAALASGRAHLAGPDGQVPGDAPESWGWRCEEAHGGPAWRPQCRRVGWVAEGAVYLEPEASYAEAQQLSGQQGESIPITVRTLRKRLREQGYLASTDREREVLTVRRNLEGKRREVLHLRPGSLSIPEPDQPDQSGKKTVANSRVAGRFFGALGENPTTLPDQKPSKNGEMVGLVGSDTE